MASRTGDPKGCDECGKTETEATLSDCSACRLVSYCSRECQLKARPAHKAACSIEKTCLAALEKQRVEGTDNANQLYNQGGMHHAFGNFAESYKFCSQAAALGHMEAQCNTGQMHAQGNGVPKSAAKALVWYGKAAAQGDAQAESNLGVMHQEGQATPVDLVKSTAFFRKAAEKGHCESQYSMGKALENGYGVPRDDFEAVMWYRKAAAQGMPMAKNNLSVMINAGRGVNPEHGMANFAESNQALFEAAEAGNASAKAAVAELTLCMARMGTDEIATAKADKAVRQAMADMVDSRNYNTENVEKNLERLKLTRTCDACGKSEAEARGEGSKLRYCSECKLAKYCSKECMAQSWPTHQTACDKARADKKAAKAPASDGASEESGAFAGMAHPGAPPEGCSTM